MVSARLSFSASATLFSRVTVAFQTFLHGALCSRQIWLQCSCLLSFPAVPLLALLKASEDWCAQATSADGLDLLFLIEFGLGEALSGKQEAGGGRCLRVYLPAPSLLVATAAMSLQCQTIHFHSLSAPGLLLVTMGHYTDPSYLYSQCLL